MAGRRKRHPPGPDRDTIGPVSDFRDMARDPKHKRGLEKLLYLAAKRRDADLVAHRSSWGITPTFTFGTGTTPLSANARGYTQGAGPVRPRLKPGATPPWTNEAGPAALDYARRKLARLLA